jgi:hypothetical protein
MFQSVIPTFRPLRIEKKAITDMGAEQANDLLVNRSKVEYLTERWLPIDPDGQDINLLKGLKYPSNGRC